MAGVLQHRCAQSFQSQKGKELKEKGKKQAREKKITFTFLILLF
jgi:hypothetical protein